MEFFNKKDEVIDFQLTEYGKYLLSIGRLKPSYYAFFDDNIVYDTNCAGFKESPSEAEPRIQTDTPSLKPVPVRTGAEQRVASFIQQITDLTGPNSDAADNAEIFSQVESFEDKGRLNAYPLGNSSLDTPYDAAWDVQLHSVPNISSTTSYLNTGYVVNNGTRVYATSNEGGVENIPQINVDIDYKMFYASPIAGSRMEQNESNYAIPNVPLDMRVENNYLLVEINEENTPFDVENFDIEVFHSGSDGTFTQLSYLSTGSADFVPLRPIENDLNTLGNVEYYMTIRTDDDISDVTYQQANIATGARSRPGFVRDIYKSDNEEPC